MNALTETEKAYLAGLVDGEGCIHIGKRASKNTPTPGYTLMLIISQSNGDFLKYWMDRVGLGSLHYQEGPSRGSGIKDKYRVNCRRAYAWHIHSAGAGELIKEILPYLILKREQAELAIEFQATQNIHRKSGRKGNRLPPEIIANRERLRLLVKNKNQHKDTPIDVTDFERVARDGSQIPMFSESF